MFDIARTVDLPIIGVGGVGRGIDALQFTMVGASAVGVCTAAILQGPEVFGKIAREMAEWLEQHGYSSLGDIRGLSIRRWRERGQPGVFRAALDTEACIGCGRCETSCVYDAIRVANGKAILSEELCAGCGLCVTRCPVRALALEPIH